MKRYDAVQITADNTNVFNGRLGGRIPPWARKAYFQLVASDTDWTFSASIGGVEGARDAAPMGSYTDNLQEINLTRPVVEWDLPGGDKSGLEILVNVNVVTAGVGVAAIVFE